MVRKQSKKAINLANISWNDRPQAGDVFISSFRTSIGGQGSEERYLTVRQRGRFSLRQAITNDYNNKSKEKQVKESVPTGSQNWLFLARKVVKKILRKKVREDREEKINVGMSTSALTVTSQPCNYLRNSRQRPSLGHHLSPQTQGTDVSCKPLPWVTVEGTRLPSAGSPPIPLGKRVKFIEDLFSFSLLTSFSLGGDHPPEETTVNLKKEVQGAFVSVSSCGFQPLNSGNSLE